MRLSRARPSAPWSSPPSCLLLCPRIDQEHHISCQGSVSHAAFREGGGVVGEGGFFSPSEDLNRPRANCHPKHYPIQPERAARKPERPARLNHPPPLLRIPIDLPGFSQLSGLSQGWTAMRNPVSAGLYTVQGVCQLILLGPRSHSVMEKPPFPFY